MTKQGQPDDNERQQRAEYVREHADKKYGVPLTALQDYWHDANKRFFAGRLVVPHLEFGAPHPRSVASCAAQTDYGASMRVTLHRKLVIDPINRNWVLKPWPAEGLCHFVEDLALRFLVRQYVLEVEHTDENGYEGFGPHFQQHANRIGAEERLSEVLVRRRRASDKNKPVCSGWPHNVRGRAYYGDAITQELFDLATGGGEAKPEAPPSPSLAVMEFVLFLLRENHAEQAEAFLRRHTERLLGRPTMRQRARRAVEDGRVSHDGSALGEVAFDSKWLAWNGGTIGRMAETIAWHGAWSEMPILADMLEVAGCSDERVLGHLRADSAHSKRCWVLRGLLNAGAGAEPCQPLTAGQNDQNGPDK
jgi:hypothetical protein